MTEKGFTWVLGLMILASIAWTGFMVWAVITVVNWLVSK